ncbi:hypothetical protein [Trichlorobacter lovleyi]|uniref:hypothetical protein n=1 Tax=Trichlorobacter lovleyi TaxID=313985 RepID=UPI0024812F04|nr:hypothetical protein [Trichlorobacter lovleyi]
MKLFSQEAREVLCYEVKKQRRMLILVAVVLFLSYVLPALLTAIDPGHNQRIVDRIKAKQQQQEVADAAKNKP